LVAVWESAADGSLGPLQAWHDFTAAACEGLLEVWREADLAGSPGRRWPEGGRLGAACWPVAGILLDLLHMTHNRLGVANPDEIYLAWLVARALEVA
jgi:hypothetical protein